MRVNTDATADRKVGQRGELKGGWYFFVFRGRKHQRESSSMRREEAGEGQEKLILGWGAGGKRACL